MNAPKKTVWQKIVHEVEEILGVSLYFALWFGVGILLKKLILESYQIEFRGITMMIIGSLVMAKVIILMELIPLGKWVERQPGIVDVLLRTVLYLAGVFIVILLEKGLESMKREGGFREAVSYIFAHRDIYHIYASTIIAGLSIFFYNMLIVLKRHLPPFEFAHLFFVTPLEESAYRKPKVASGEIAR